MGCCTAIENFFKDPIGSIEDFFDGEDIQSVGVSMQPIMPLDTIEANAMMNLRKKAKAYNTSIAKQLIEEYTTGRFFHITDTIRYLRKGNGLDGEAKFKVLGDTGDYRNFLLSQLALESGVVGATSNDVYINSYSDTEVPSMDCIAYKYLYDNGAIYGSWNNDNIFTFDSHIDINSIDFLQSEPQIQQTTNVDTSGSSNEIMFNTPKDLKVVNIWAMNKKRQDMINDVLCGEGENPILNQCDYTLEPPNDNLHVIVLELEDPLTNDIYYYELRELSLDIDNLNMIIVHYGVTGSDCCYFYTYQLGSDVHSELENVTEQTIDNSYSTFTLFPIICLKYNGEYVADMKDTNYDRYIDTKTLCRKIGYPLKYLDAIIKERGTTPAEQQQADDSHSQTKDTFIEYGLNIDRDSHSNYKALWYTAKMIKEHTTSKTVFTNDGQSDSTYSFSISYDENTTSRYNKNIRIGNINTSTHSGVYTVRKYDAINGVTLFEPLPPHKYLKEKYLIEEGSELLADGSNGEMQYQIRLNTKSHYSDYKSVLRLVYQGENEYTIYDIESLATHSTVVDGGNAKGAAYNMFDSFSFSDSQGTNVTLPLFAEIVNHFNYSEQYALYGESIHIINFASVTTHLSWYETGFFFKLVQVVLIVVAVVILIATLGTGAGFSAYLLAIASGLASGMAIRYMLYHVSSPWLKAILIIAYVALMAETGNVSDIDDTLMLLASTSADSINIHYQQEMKRERESFDKFRQSLNSKLSELEEKQKQFIEPNVIGEEIVIETPDQFYDRVLNNDIIELVDSMYNSFVSSDLDSYLDTDNLYLKK